MIILIKKNWTALCFELDNKFKYGSHIHAQYSSASIAIRFVCVCVQ